MQGQGPRIGDKKLGARAATRVAADMAPLATAQTMLAPSLQPTEQPRLVTRMGAAVASPLGVLVVVPGLVLAVGVLLTIIGQAALARSSLALGRQQVTAHNSLISRDIGQALGQADAVLERLRALALVHDPEQPFDAAAATMRDLMQGRPGVAYVSLSFPDGTFQGGYIDTDGSLRFQDSRVRPNGTHVRRYGTNDRKRLELFKEEITSYDPRQRGFYKLAVGAKEAVWTKPYPFFKTHFTGITRTQALRDSAGKVRSVLTVDFDVNELSRALDRVPIPGARVLLYTDDGTLLADPSAAKRIQTLPLSDRTLSYRDLKDPLLDAFFAAAADAAAMSFEANGESHLMDRASVGEPALGWHVATMLPEEVLLGPSRVYKESAVVLALAALGVAFGVALLFARHVVRMRKETAEARAVAKRAVAEAQDLGSYRLVSRLGAGGMGEVWRAEHRLLARQAAIKLIRPEANSGAEGQERFRREAQTLATLRSRNTIELFDYGVTDDGMFFYVMELLDGMDLETLVTRFGPQPPARVCSLLMQACSSLAEAHAAGLVHRDIKPANLYLCRAADEVDVLKILDFGLVRSLGDVQTPGPSSLEELEKELESESRSKSESESGSGSQSQSVPLSKLTAAGVLMGTPDYMAPEQILAHETDGRADIYALGCVAYYVLTGKVPFPGKEQIALLLAHLQETPPPLEGRVPGLPPEMARIIMRCMAKAPEDRPATASVIKHELMAIQFPADNAWTEETASGFWERNVPRVAAQPSLGPLSPKGSLARSGRAG